MYFFNFLDRNAMINGRLSSLEEDLGLEGTQYNTLVSILFVGYAPPYAARFSEILTRLDTCVARSPPT